MSKPVFLLATNDALVLQTLTADLHRRFGLDYEVLGAVTSSAALEMASQLAGEGRETALLVADEDMQDLAPIEFLARAHAICP